MSADLPALLIIANSGRAMAQSAARGGFSVSVFDGFCDQDTQAVANCRPVRIDADGLDPDCLLDELESFARGQSVPMIYGAGLEGRSSLLGRLSERGHLLGNDPAIQELICDPAAYFALLDRLQIPYPETRLTPPEATSGAPWLLKKAGSSGGQGVSYWNHQQPRPHAGCYYQRYLQGVVMSALFIADGESCRIIGFNRLRRTNSGGSTPFLYGGALGQASLPGALRKRVERYVEKLVSGLGLRGVNSLDFILSRGDIFVLDLNARPPATLELYEHEIAGGWMKQHVRACLGSLTETPPPVTAAMVYGHRIVYAPRDTQIPDAMIWPQWTRDRPVAGTRIGRGEPVCSLFSHGRDADAVEFRLQRYQGEILLIIPSLTHKPNQGKSEL
jgi:predicted ATP-grasp superfamily ATP-dependent carboligase